MTAERRAGPDFADINRRMLARFSELVERWLPGGHYRGREYVALNPKRSDHSKHSFSINTETGAWADFASGEKGGDLISLCAFLNDLKNGEAARHLDHLLGGRTTETNGARPPCKEKRSWKPLVPAPEHVRRPDGLPWPGVPFPKHRELGTPRAICWFEDANGRTLFGEARFEPPGQEKQTRPLTYCEPDGFKGRPGWNWKGPDKLYPIFNLPRLAAEPGKPRLLTEGPRKAVAATCMFPDYVPTAMLFGAASPHLADCRPLAGSAVTIWPDHDEAGAKFLAEAAKRLMLDGVIDVRVVAVPEHFPQRWDLADPLPEGVTLEMLAELLRLAKPWVAPVKPVPRAADAAPAIEDEAEIAQLAKLPTTTYERERRAAAERLGYRAPILDKLVEAARGDADPASANNVGQGRRLSFRDVEPWPDPVDGAALLDEIARTIRRYVVLDEPVADAVALWVVHTYALDAAYVSPRLAITSPEKRCGKTTLLTVLGALAARALATANMTTATIFRVIEAARRTLLIDEADSFLGDADEMRGVINAGHCRATATVLRTVETREGYEVREFSVWGAVALAAIGRLPGTIEDRAIKVALRRRRPDEPAERLRLDRLEELAPIARRVARWTTDNLDTLRATDPDVPAELHDRAADNWRTLLAVADAAGGVWPERARRAAVALTRDGADDTETVRTMLLADVKAAFDAKATDRLASEDIIAYLTGLEDRPWPEFRGGKAITKVQLARLLKPLRISSGTIRLDDGKTPKGYYLSTLKDAFLRYLLPDRNATPPQAADSVAFAENRNATSRAGVAFRNPQKPKDAAGCGVVAGQGRPRGANGNARASGGDPWALEI
jgi:hypothetical protein